MPRILLPAALATAAAAGWLALSAGSSESGFDRSEVAIAMRDGTRLHTEINVPKNTREPLPILMVRTPYSAAHMSAGLAGGGFSHLAADGYIFVFQDIRGRFESEGRFVMMRPPRASRDPKAADESTDAYDTIDWLVHHVPRNNGRVGVFGVSYPGWLTVMAMIEPHPALKAVSEQASPADMFLGDDFFHNGAFRLTYGFEYAAQMEGTKTNKQFEFDRWDLFEWYYHLLPLSSANTRDFHGRLPTWNAFEQHPDYDSFWQSIAVPRYLGPPTVPNLNVAGWWDQEDFYGPQKIYETLEKNDARHLNYFAVGPWNHGGWQQGDGRKLGQIDFSSNTAADYRAGIEAPWFAWWLKGKGSGRFVEARAFETGSNRWRDFEEWPPRAGFSSHPLYLRAGGELSFSPPPESDACESYVSDPMSPVPYRGRPIGPTYGRPGWATWELEDQRFVDRRPDVLSWQTEPLAAPVTIAGDIVANLFASTSGSDADWIVKLIDVYPEEYAPQPDLGGYQLMIGGEIFRARFRNSFERAEPVPPLQVLHYAIDLHTHSHVFLEGHRLMVQIQSTWFPLYSRNPQKFVPNIFLAAPADYRPATHNIYRSREFPTHLLLPLAEKGSA
jgi:putative CocE/NonD family hydrolase